MLSNQKRYVFILVFIFIVGVIFITRLFQLQVINNYKKGGSAGETLSASQMSKNERGEIFAADNYLNLEQISRSGEYKFSPWQLELTPLAMNMITYDLIATPAEIIDSPVTVINKLSSHLKINPNLLRQDILEETEESSRYKDLIAKLSNKNDLYEVLAKDINYEEAQQIKALGISGLSFEEKYQRYYPQKDIFGQITGFLGWVKDERSGQYGIEEYLDPVLKDGRSVVLSMSPSLQFFVNKILQERCQTYQVESGSVIVADPNTGAILALANCPNFDPNEYSQASPSLFKNPVVNEAYEPGSVFKLITMSAGLEEGKITPETSYVDTGEAKYGRKTIKNALGKKYGLQTMTGVLENSINTGVIFVVNRLGADLFKDTIKRFGFGEITNLEISGEAKGDISSLDKKGDTYLPTASFGQGISITPIQMVAAVSAIANGGKLFKPTILKYIQETSDVAPVAVKPVLLKQVISPETTTQLTKMMVSVTENGQAKAAQLNNFFVAGKTGTAEIAEEGSYTDKNNHSFVGFFPASKPQFVILVKFKNPKNGRFADSTAAPTFAEIGDFIAKQYNLKPEK